MSAPTVPELRDPHNLLDQTNRKLALEYARGVATKDASESTVRGLGLRRADIITAAGMRYLGAYNPSKVGTTTVKKMLTDPQVALMLAAGKAPCRTTTWSVKCESKELKALVEKALLETHARTVLTHQFDAVDFGYHVDEVRPERKTVEFSWEDEGGTLQQRQRPVFVPHRFKDLDPADYRFVLDELGELVGITQAALVRDGPMLVELEHLAHYTSEMKYGNPHGFPRVARVYNPWYWETVLYLLCNQYFERRAVPSHVLYADPEDAPTDPDTKKRAKNALQSISLLYQRLLKSQSVVALWSKMHPDSKERLWDLKVLQDEPRGEQFIGYFQHLDTKIARGLLMPERAASGNDATGSFSQTLALRGLGDLLGNAMLDDTADVWNEQIVPRFSEWNGITDEIRVAHSGITPDAAELYQEVLGHLFNAEQAIVEGRDLGEIQGLLVSMVDGARLLERIGVPTREIGERGQADRPKPKPEKIEVRGGGDPEDEDGRPVKGSTERKAAAFQAVAPAPAQAVADDTGAPDVARMRMAGLTSEFQDMMAEVEGEVAKLTAPQKEEVDRREQAAKAVLLLLLLMSGKKDQAGAKVAGVTDLEGLVWKKGAGSRKVLRSPRVLAANLPKLEARAATLPGGGLRLSDTGNTGLMRRHLRGVRDLVGPAGLKAGLADLGKGLRDGVGNMMNLAANHYTRANRKGAWGIRANVKAILRKGYPGRNKGAAEDSPPEEKWRRRPMARPGRGRQKGTSTADRC